MLGYRAKFQVNRIGGLDAEEVLNGSKQNRPTTRFLCEVTCELCVSTNKVKKVNDIFL